VVSNQSETHPQPPVNNVIQEQCELLLQYEEELARRRKKNAGDSFSVMSNESELHPQNSVGRDLQEQCEILLRHEEELARRRKRLRSVKKSDSI